MFDTHHSSPITHHPILRLLLAAGLVLALCAALAGCGMIEWSVSRGGDGCPPKSTVPCP